MTYWDVNDIEVDNIMTDFLQKSLAKSVFDDNLATYVYSIHILFLDYLKTGLTKDEERVRQLALNPRQKGTVFATSFNICRRNSTKIS